MVAADIHKNNISPTKIEIDDDMPELVDFSNDTDSDFEDEHKDSDDEIEDGFHTAVQRQKLDKAAKSYEDGENTWWMSECHE
eukprot:9459617-Ditylum_brightwellii.AAC.1